MTKPIMQITQQNAFNSSFIKAIPENLYLSYLLYKIINFKTYTRNKIYPHYTRKYILK